MRFSKSFEERKFRSDPTSLSKHQLLYQDSPRKLSLISAITDHKRSMGCLFLSHLLRGQMWTQHFCLPTNFRFGVPPIFSTCQHSLGKVSKGKIFCLIIYLPENINYPDLATSITQSGSLTYVVQQ